MTCGAARSILLALLTLAVVPPARGDAEGRTRVTIRGTGRNVTIERAEAPIPKRKAAVRGDILAEAIRLEEQGADDETVIGYLRLHQAELPPVVGAETVRRLRRAGAEESVIAYLSTLAALDIGETGEGAPIAVMAPPSSGGESAYGMPYAYGLAAGYPLGIGSGASHIRRFGPRRFFPSRRFGFHPRGPTFRKGSPMRAGPPRRPIAR